MAGAAHWHFGDRLLIRERRKLARISSALRELGYAEGQSITLVTRSVDGRNERLRGLAAELIGLRVDIIVTTGTPAAVAAKQATSTIPIVMAGRPTSSGWRATPCVSNFG